MRGGVIAVVSLLAASGCGEDCLQSADIRLALDGPVALLGQVKALAVGVAVDGGPRRVQKLTLAIPLESGKAVLLQPSETIAGAEYSIAIDVAGLDAGDEPLLSGKLTQTVGTHACNRLSLSLAGPADMSIGGFDQATSEPDLSGIDLTMPNDLSTPPDLAPCTATTPDEDGDGRGDACDVCAANANATITDGDSDGVPDPCDPAPAAAGNHVVYFEPFANQNTWTGTIAVSGGKAQVTGTGGAFTDVTTAANNGTVALPGSVWMQTYVTPSSITAGIDGGVRIALWTTVGSAGYLCEAEVQSIGNPVLKIRELGAGSTGVTLGNGGAFASGQTSRVRMWQHGLTIGCEWAKPDGSNPVTVMRAIATAPTVLHPGVGVGFESYSNSGGATATYSSVFAVSYP